MTIAIGEKRLWNMNFLKDIALLFGLALITVVLFRKLYFPSIIGFLVTGILAGPHALAVIKNTHEVEKMAEIGVVLLLFTIGIELSLKELMRIKHLLLWGGGLQVGVTILAVTAVGMAAGYAAQPGDFFRLSGGAFQHGYRHQALDRCRRGRLAPWHDSPWASLSFRISASCRWCWSLRCWQVAVKVSRGCWLIVAKAAAVVLAAHFGARFLVPWIFAQVVKTRSRELFILTIIFIGLGTAWLTSLAGLSLALGAFIAGLAISESEYSHQALSDIIPFREAFLSLFFISVGMLLDPGHSAAISAAHRFAGHHHPASSKSLVTTGAALALGVPLRIAIITALSLAQIGEFSFVLSQAGVKAGLLTPELYQIFLAASIATMGLDAGLPQVRRTAGGLSLSASCPTHGHAAEGCSPRHEKTDLT